MGKKSAAQLRRLEKRAKARGETYVPPPLVEETSKDDETTKENDNPVCNEAASKKAGIDATNDNATRMNAAKKLVKELKSISDNTELKSKDRRSLKRRAEAISSEETGMDAEELLKWYEANKSANDDDGNETKKKKDKGSSNTTRRDPLIAFVGQLSYETTADDLFEHIREHLQEDFPKSKLTREQIKIRLLTDSKTKRSRGMAFAEVKDDPELLYALLKLHQTYLKGRRINIERSAGGGKKSAARQSKLEAYRQEQTAHFASVVENILDEYRKTGELREDELDEGVITVCKRHAGPVVRAAVAEYIEKGGNTMDNPSAYLTFLVTKFAKEGINGIENERKPKKQKTTSSNNKSNNSGNNNGMSGVDMSLSRRLGGTKESTPTKDLSKIFPSSQRGRGRGYMRNVRR